MSSLANVQTLIQAAITEAQSIGTPPPPPPPPGNLSTLAANTARNLGSFLSGQPGGGFITDYSGTTYDPVAKRVLLFGGGHGQGNETDIRAFNSASGWSSLYPSTPWAAMLNANGDSDKGRWISTNHPYARHTYGLTCVVGRRFYIFAWQGMPYSTPDTPPNWNGRICWCQLDDPAFPWSYSKIPGNQTPYGPYNNAACLDPVSGNVLILGEGINAGAGTLHLYDPVADSIHQGDYTPQFFSHRTMCNPVDGCFYTFSNHPTNGVEVWKLTLNRTNLMASTFVRVAVNPNVQSRGSYCAYDYDSVNKIFGGFPTQTTDPVERLKFVAFDPVTLGWDSKTMQIEAGSAGSPYFVWRCASFYQAEGVYIGLNEPNSATTWAYRYK